MTFPHNYVNNYIGVTRRRQAEARKAGGGILRPYRPGTPSEVDKMDEILTIIGNYAFPIVCCIAMFWKLDKDQDRHQTEMDKLRESLDGNTRVLQELATLIKRDL